MSESRVQPLAPLDEPATRTRYLVLIVLSLLAGILYLDRICLGQALPSMQKELKFDNAQASYVAMAFTLAYGLFEVPTGRWGDVIGARRVLTRISIWWSAFTALTGACSSLSTLIVVRFLFGAGEAGAFPNVARVLWRWFPDHERGRVQGVLLAASQLGGASSPALAAMLIATVGWRVTFVIFGVTGVVWAIGFWLWYRDDPAEHPQVNAAEAAYIAAGRSMAVTHAPLPWRLILTNPSVWFLGTIMTLGSYNSYLYFTWFPKYLQQARDVSPTDSGWLTTLVLTGSAIGTLCGGVVVDALVQGRGVARRRLVGGCAFAIAALCLFAGLACESPMLMAFLAACSCLMTQGTQPLWWSSAISISGRHIGALFGLMNSMGVVGALTSQWFAGRFTEMQISQGLTGRAVWDPVFYINAGVLLLASLAWSCFVMKTVEDHEE